MTWRYPVGVQASVAKSMRLLAVFLLLLVPFAGRAEPLDGPLTLPGLTEEPSPSPWRVAGGVWSMSPVALRTGMPVGLAMEVRRRIGDGPVLLGARLGYAVSNEANVAWELSHDHGLLALTAGVEKTRGVGTLFAQLGAGAMVLRAVATRHQYDRLKDLGVTDLERVGWSVGPSVWAEAGVAVQLRGGWSVLLSGGPTFGHQNVDGTGLSRWGAQTVLGVYHAL